MHQNIKINNVRALDAKLYNAKYYDFMLYKGEIANQSLDDLNGMAIADFSSLYIVSGVLYSTVLWNKAINNGVDMVDIGYTGVDNGLISYHRDAITNEEFLKIYFNSEYKIESGDTRLFLTPVTGNTQQYIYPMYFTTDENGASYISCKGGFYQGFFKLDGFDYQVLPNNIENEWMMHFEIRPRSDYEVGPNTVNHIHPDNKGIFFFMGTRAENKWWPFYKTDSDTVETFRKNDAQAEGYFSGCEGESGDTYNVNEDGTVTNPWVNEELEERPKEDGYFIKGDGYYAFDKGESATPPSSAETIPPMEHEEVFIKGDGYIDFNDMYGFMPEILSSQTDTVVIAPSKKSVIKGGKIFLNTYGYNLDKACMCVGCDEEEKKEEPKEEECEPCCTHYFHDDYYDNQCPEEDNNKFVVDEFIGKEVEIDTDMSHYTDSEGRSMVKHGYQEITTDNKYVMFDHTPDGFNTHNWVEGTEVTLTRRQDWPNANYFLLMNRTPTGYTTHTIQEYNEQNSYDYNIYKDIRGNVFALRVTENGAIGYRYGVLNCDNDNKYEVIEEYSKDGLVKLDEWNSINVRFCVLNPGVSSCDTRPRKMRISFYVNGFLVFISKELDAFRFKSLDEVSEKQEAVPYNISLGGGSIGLLETILPNYYAISDYILPIERDFCGTFLGDIKSFKMYEGFINYSTITHYLS